MKLSEARARKLLSIQELAKMSGVSRANIHALEVGKWLPTLRTVRKLCEVLEVDPMEVDEFKAAIERTAQGKENPARV